MVIFYNKCLSNALSAYILIPERWNISKGQTVNLEHTLTRVCDINVIKQTFNIKIKQNLLIIIFINMHMKLLISVRAELLHLLFKIKQ